MALTDMTIPLSSWWPLLILLNAIHRVAAFTKASGIQRPIWLLPVQLQAHHQGGHNACDDKAIDIKAERTVVLLYNKPTNTVTSHANDDAPPQGTEPRRTVYQDIATLGGYVGPETPVSFQQLTGITSKLSAIGRLDADTSGLLLLTNDGALLHHVTNPTAHAQDDSLPVTKTYLATIMGHYQNDAPAFHAMRTVGVDIGDKYGGMTKPAAALIVLDHPTGTSTTCQLTIGEGRNRQVRRMFHAIGSGVMALRRTAIGTYLTLGDLKEGQWRVLSDDEVKQGLGWEPRVLSAMDLSKGANSKPATIMRPSKARRRKKK
jgi:pseudouridine synthase